MIDHERIGLADDGFGNLLNLAGSWYLEHIDEPLPEGVIRGNYAGALAFIFGHWHQPSPDRKIVRGIEGRAKEQECSPIKVLLTIPDDQKHNCEYPNSTGLYYGYHGRIGEVVASAGNGGMWVAFNGPFEAKGYTGCPVKWLTKVQE
jgi:hypothetical protein